MILLDSGGQQSPPVGVPSPTLNPVRAVVPHFEMSGAVSGAAPTDGTEVRLTAPVRPPRPRRTFRRSTLLTEFSEEPALQETLCFRDVTAWFLKFLEINGQDDVGDVAMKEDEKGLAVVPAAVGVSVDTQIMVLGWVHVYGSLHGLYNIIFVPFGFVHLSHHLSLKT